MTSHVIERLNLNQIKRKTFWQDAVDFFLPPIANFLILISIVSVFLYAESRISIKKNSHPNALLSESSETVSANNEACTDGKLEQKIGSSPQKKSTSCKMYKIQKWAAAAADACDVSLKTEKDAQGEGLSYIYGRGALENISSQAIYKDRRWEIKNQYRRNLNSDNKSSFCQSIIGIFKNYPAGWITQDEFEDDNGNWFFNLLAGVAAAFGDVLSAATGLVIYAMSIGFYALVLLIFISHEIIKAASHLPVHMRFGRLAYFDEVFSCNKCSDSKKTSTHSDNITIDSLADWLSLGSPRTRFDEIQKFILLLNDGTPALEYREQVQNKVTRAINRFSYFKGHLLFALIFLLCYWVFQLGEIRLKLWIVQFTLMVFIFSGIFLFVRYTFIKSSVQLAEYDAWLVGGVVKEGITDFNRKSWISIFDDDHSLIFYRKSLWQFKAVLCAFSTSAFLLFLLMVANEGFKDNFILILMGLSLLLCIFSWITMFISKNNSQ